MKTVEKTAHQERGGAEAVTMYISKGQSSNCKRAEVSKNAWEKPEASWGWAWAELGQAQFWLKLDLPWYVWTDLLYKLEKLDNLDELD